MNALLFALALAAPQTGASQLYPLYGQQILVTDTAIFAFSLKAQPFLHADENIDGAAAIADFSLRTPGVRFDAADVLPFATGSVTAYTLKTVRLRLSGDEVSPSYAASVGSFNMVFARVKTEQDESAPSFTPSVHNFSMVTQ